MVSHGQGHAHKKSILIINRTFPPAFGATGRMACDLALHLRAQNHHVTILTTAASKKIDRAKHLTVHRIGANQKPQSAFDYFKILFAMRRAAKNLDHHDIVISMTDPPFQALIGDKIAKSMTAHHIHWAMDLYPDLFPVIGFHKYTWIFSVIKKLMQRAVKNADVIVPIGKCMAQYLSYQSIPRKKMVVIENWADKYLREDNGEPDKALLDDQKFRILYAGTIGLAHDFDIVLKAAKYLQKNAPHIEFIFTNRGRGANALQQKINRHHLDNIKLLSPQPSKKLSALMASGDLHLITMKDEAAGKLLPSKFYSAIAAGRPSLFIGPKSCDLHKKITDNNCGQSIRNNDVKSLINAILNYYNDGQLWFEHCDNAKNLHANHHPLDQWSDLIDRL